MGARSLPANADPTNSRVPLPDAFLRPVVGYNGVSINENNSSSNYHSLQVTANRRFVKNLETGLAWTWSKALDYNDADFGAINTVAPLREWNYGRAGFDRRHVVKVNWLWSLPKKQWAFRPFGFVMNDWQISGIATFQSGAPVNVGYSLVTAADLSGTPSISPRIAVVGDPNLPVTTVAYGSHGLAQNMEAITSADCTIVSEAREYDSFEIPIANCRVTVDGSSGCRDHWTSLIT